MLYHFTLVYKKGSLNVDADALSRIAWELEEQTGAEAVVKFTRVLEVVAAPKSGKPGDAGIDLQSTLNITIAPNAAEDWFCIKVRESLASHDNYDLDDKGILRLYSTEHCIGRVVVPEKYHAKVLYLVHDHPLSGHLGSRHTFEKLHQLFVWKDSRSITNGEECKWLAEIEKNLVIMQAAVLEGFRKSQEAMKRRFNQGISTYLFKKGDLVNVQSPPHHRISKFKSRFEGPYEIIGVIRDMSLRLKHCEAKKVIQRHMSLCMTYYARDS
ncbi:hypothetical protein H4R35_001765 [Dimargaris xerosporica]|nr:hypothetical protein H4R35_001765 [Dimargaris xerosporica]